MDGSQFDDLARSLGAHAPSRRRLVGLLAAGLLAGLVGTLEAHPVAARPTRRKDSCATNECPSCRTCGHDDQGTPICKDMLDRTTCGGCNTVCADDQDCCSGTCRTRLTVDNCESCSACPPGEGWVCNPTMHDMDGDGVRETPGCDCIDEANCSQF
jgi:hypothetical protein